MFDFILDQLRQFPYVVIYRPEEPAKSLPIEVVFDKFTEKRYGADRLIHQSKAVNHEEVDLLPSCDADGNDVITATFQQLHDKLVKELCVPMNRLTLNMNTNKDDIGIIYMPWDLNLAAESHRKLL